jgi:NhaP-type Na+/H+ or K+/H+ antiporter
LVIYFLLKGLSFWWLACKPERCSSGWIRFSLRDLVLAVLLTVAVVIVTRFIWVFPVTYFAALVESVAPASVVSVAAPATANLRMVFQLHVIWITLLDKIGAYI